MSERRDEYGRLICAYNDVPREGLALWRGRITHYSAVRTPSEANHSRECVSGWIASGEWWLICGRCTSESPQGDKK